MTTSLTFTLAISLATSAFAAAAADHLVFEPKAKANGKHVVLISGDEEYRSEEAMPMLGQILAAQGFKATVLFSLDADGKVDPDAGGNLSHSEALDEADAIVMSLRFRHWDDSSMVRFDNALNRGVPMVALRTSTHAFNFKKDSKWAKYSYQRKSRFRLAKRIWPPGLRRNLDQPPRPPQGRRHPWDS